MIYVGAARNIDKGRKRLHHTTPRSKVIPTPKKQNGAELRVGTLSPEAREKLRVRLGRAAVKDTVSAPETAKDSSKKPTTRKRRKKTNFDEEKTEVIPPENALLLTKKKEKGTAEPAGLSTDEEIEVEYGEYEEPSTPVDDLRCVGAKDDASTPADADNIGVSGPPEMDVPPGATPDENDTAIDFIEHILPDEDLNRIAAAGKTDQNCQPASAPVETSPATAAPESVPEAPREAGNHDTLEFLSTTKPVPKPIASAETGTEAAEKGARISRLSIENFLVTIRSQRTYVIEIKPGERQSVYTTEDMKYTVYLRQLVQGILQMSVRRCNHVIATHETRGKKCSFELRIETEKGRHMEIKIKRKGRDIDIILNEKRSIASRFGGFVGRLLDRRSISVKKEPTTNVDLAQSTIGAQDGEK